MKKVLGAFLEVYKSSKDPEIIRDISKPQDAAATAGKTILYSLASIMDDAKDKILR